MRNWGKEIANDVWQEILPEDIGREDFIPREDVVQILKEIFGELDSILTWWENNRGDRAAQEKVRERLDELAHNIDIPVIRRRR